ncbi:MAG: NAD(P)/FAD-dependent oxidoreductase, partial [Pseudomonadota bacterium]
MTTHSYDLAIIGAGPGGYVAAIRAAQLGLDVAVIEQLPTLGGTCLNVGCIPSKALLNASHHFALARDHFADMGIIADPVLDLGRMMQAKQSTVENLTKGIDFLFAKNKITRLTGRAMVQAPGHIQIQDGPDQGKEVHSTSIIIATGSQSASIPGITVDEKHIVSSTGALAFQSVPDHLLVVGAGVIGLELGSVWSRLGSKVTVVEFLPRIVPSLDGEIAKNFQRILTRQGLKFITEHKLDEVEIKDQGLIAHITGVGRRQGKEARIECDRILIATGRRPVSANLGLEALGIQTDDHGFIKTD